MMVGLKEPLVLWNPQSGVAGIGQEEGAGGQKFVPDSPLLLSLWFQGLFLIRLFLAMGWNDMCPMEPLRWCRERSPGPGAPNPGRIGMGVRVESQHA